MHISIKTRYFMSHFLAVVLVSGSIGTYFYLSAVDSLMENLRGRLASTAALAAESVDLAGLETVREPGDTAQPGYVEGLAMLRRLRSTNPDIAYVYVMRRMGDAVSFVLDSDESQAQALPGRPYPDPPAALSAGFSGPSVDDKLYEDEWGVFMSGYAPLRGGQGAYLLGIDMRDAEVGRKLWRLRLSGLVSLSLSLGLAFVFATVLARRINRPLRLFMDACAAVAEDKAGARVDVRTGDELERLGVAINDMSMRLEDNELRRTQAEARLIRSRDELEVRVRERTIELSRLNALLVHEIEERKRAEEKLFQAAMTDTLTGLPNRRAMEQQLTAQAARVARGGSPFAVLLCDVDRFKSVNDAFGHEAGDEFLRAAAQVMASSVRAGDMVCRWGGEEFLFLLADTDLEGGLVAANKLRQAMEALRVPVDGFMVARSISVGVSVCADCRDKEEVLRLADEALYEAKNSGRNQVAFRVLAAAAAASA
jgi:diguanylate cyclase (GGDEF)-like protein